jgi:hypothetical protein
MTRTAFLIDGFNLYDSLRDASRDLDGAGTRWLDLFGLCSSFLNEIGGNAQFSEVGYFSALAHHLEPIEPGLVERHLAYIDCLRETGVRVELGYFKPKQVLCPGCRFRIVRHEEKETDVAIGTRLLELAVSGECDAIGVVSGDSDLAPALRASRRCRREMLLLACFPYHLGARNSRRWPIAASSSARSATWRTSFPTGRLAGWQADRAARELVVAVRASRLWR